MPTVQCSVFSVQCSVFSVQILFVGSIFEQVVSKLMVRLLIRIQAK